MKAIFLSTSMILSVLTAHAEENFATRNDVFKGLMPNDQANANEADRRIALDRTAPEFKALNAIGVVKAKGQNFYGTGFLISPCHVLTNKHVVYYNSQEASIGARVYFSVGQPGVSQEQFSDADITGRVIAFGDYNNNDETRNGDWAIIKLSKAIGKKVGYLPYTQVKDPAKLTNRPSLTVGFPGSMTNGGNDFSKIYGDLNCKISNMNALEYLNHTCQQTAGQSGSPILTKDSAGNYYAIGMISGSNDCGKESDCGMARNVDPNKANMAVNFISGADFGTQTQGDKIAEVIVNNKCE